MTRQRPKELAWHDLNAHRRLLYSLATAAIVALTLPAGLTLPVRLTASWDTGVVFFIALTWRVIYTCPPQAMQGTVLAYDQGRVGILALVLAATVASLSAIFFLLQKARGFESVVLTTHVILAVFTIVCSWVLTHVMFALHYAHRYYRDDPNTPEMDATGGLQFPGEQAPHYWDFVYFAFVIGMTFQVSDVQVNTRPMRLLVLWHSVLSFTFYSLILSICINIVAGMI